MYGGTENICFDCRPIRANQSDNGHRRLFLLAHRSRTACDSLMGLMAGEGVGRLPLSLPLWWAYVGGVLLVLSVSRRSLFVRAIRGLLFSIFA